MTIQTMRARIAKTTIALGVSCGLTAAALLATPPALADDVTPTPTATPVVKSVDKTVGHSASLRSVKITGTDLASVTSVKLGSLSLAIKSVSNTKLVVEVPVSPTFKAKKSTYSLIYKEVGVDGFDYKTVKTTKSFTWQVTSGRDRQLVYMVDNLFKRGSSTYAYYYKEDCSNFTSQTLHARGMAYTAAWKPGAKYWVSSTNLRRYLLGTGKFTELSDTQANRAKVNIGDVIQFDWDRSGDRDHTGIVTGIETAVNGKITILYSAHTDNGNNPSENMSIEQSKINHQKKLKLKVSGKAYFLHFK